MSPHAMQPSSPFVAERRLDLPAEGRRAVAVWALAAHADKEDAHAQSDKEQIQSARLSGPGWRTKERESRVATRNQVPAGVESRVPDSTGRPVERARGAAAAACRAASALDFVCGGELVSALRQKERSMCREQQGARAAVAAA